MTDLDELKEDQKSWMLERGKYLQSITMKASDTGLHFLFVTNTGGAASVLAYLGAIAQKSEDLMIFKTSLAIFFIGIILVGVFRAYTAEIYGKVFWEFNELTNKYFKEKMEWVQYIEEAEQQALKLKNNIGRILVYSSFLCFVSGAILGVIGLVS